MGQFVGAVKGIGEAVAALGMPIVSGNVSLYNETDGSAILPTPTIGAVGILRSSSDIIGFKIEAGYIALLLGTTRGHLGQSALMAEAYHRAEGDAPPVDLTAEAAHGDFIRAHHAHIAACTDLSDGGLALAAFEMAHHANLGLSIDTADTAQLFGEDQARYLIAATPAHATQLLNAAKAANIPLRAIGTFGGETLAFGTASAPLSDLATLYRNSFAQAIA